jgi:HAMP domain-containing protein
VTLFLNALGAIVLGALGWFALEFLGRPCREFFNIRREAKLLMLRHWDQAAINEGDPAGNFPTNEELQAIRNAFRDLTDRLAAFVQSETVAAWAIKFRYDTATAIKVLRKISIYFGIPAEDRDKDFRRVDVALRFRFDPKRQFYNPYDPG